MKTYVRILLWGCLVCLAVRWAGAQGLSVGSNGSVVIGGAASNGVLSINGITGAFTFSGGVSCISTTCTFTGSSAVSNQAAGVIPLGSSATTIGAQSHCNETTTGLTLCTQPFGVSASGSPTEQLFTYNTGFPPGTGGASQAMLAVSSGGKLEVSNAGAAQSLFCVAANLGTADCPVALTVLAAQAADTAVMNASGSSAAPTAVPLPTTGTNGCAGASNALTYNNSTHAYGCDLTSTQTIANGQASIPVTALAGNSCDASATTATATGAATTDTATVSYASDPTGVTGYGGGTNGGITISAWLTSNTFNFKRCNQTASSITPGALSLNWRVTR